MNTTHTPGPWEVHGETTDELFYVHGANTICDIHRGAYSKFGDPRFSRTPREDEANAALIAAAPELLDACIAAIGNARGWRAMMRRAIKKAMTIENPSLTANRS